MEVVMIVDDEPSVLHIAASMLRKKGYSVITAKNGLDCLAYMRKGFQGVILLDISMPQLDGWQTLRILKDEQLLDRTLVCMLTGFQPRGAEAGLEDCVVDYLTKPFSSKSLNEMVAAAFRLLSL
jgi:CheY-like chemotaxis protein